ncbi:MAG: MotE family protein [Pseudomonadota bacterium]
MIDGLKHFGMLLTFASLVVMSKPTLTTADQDISEEASALREEYLGVDVGIDRMAVGVIPKENESNRYCVNIYDKAKEARHVVLMDRLQGMQSIVDEKLVEMNQRIVELRTWTEKREQFLSRAKDSLVEIFQTMRSDSAALQMTEMGPVMSAAIIAKLEPKFSSAILAEMEPGDAAKITLVLTDAVDLNE